MHSKVNYCLARFLSPSNCRKTEGLPEENCEKELAAQQLFDYGISFHARLESEYVSESHKKAQLWFTTGLPHLTLISEAQEHFSHCPLTPTSIPEVPEVLGITES